MWMIIEHGIADP